VKPLTENPATKVEVLVQALFFARWCNRDHTLVELNPNLLSDPKSLKKALAQGNLLKGIDNCSGVARSVVQRS
jgi:hypothetical protein